jgi:hypothetical protein
MALAKRKHIVPKSKVSIAILNVEFDGLSTYAFLPTTHVNSVVEPYLDNSDLAPNPCLRASGPQGLLMITRQIFLDSLAPYIRLKQSKSFDVYVVTVEWTQEHVTGAYVRVKIRKSIRQYYFDNGLKYTMLIGETVDISVRVSEMQPPPSLSEAWNLPAGYVWWNCLTNDGSDRSFAIVLAILISAPVYCTLRKAGLSDLLK